MRPPWWWVPDRLDPAYDASSVRDQDETVDAAWYQRTRRALGDHTATSERNRP